MILFWGSSTFIGSTYFSLHTPLHALVPRTMLKVENYLHFIFSLTVLLYFVQKHIKHSIPNGKNKTGLEWISLPELSSHQVSTMFFLAPDLLTYSSVFIRTTK